MLVGRARELAAIAATLAQARAGTKAALVVVGEAGIGKSTLLAEARATVESDVVILETTGAEPESDLPFAGLEQLLRPILHRIDELPQVQARALAQALALRAGEPTAGGDGAGGPNDEATVERFAVSAATLGLISLAAEEQPVLVLVDDLHSLDRPSADAIAFTARRLLTDAVAAVLVVRPDTDAEQLVADLPRLEVAGLSRGECGSLLLDRSISDRSFSDAELDRLHELSGGNPLAIQVIARSSEALLTDVAPVPVPRLIQQAALERGFTGLPTTTQTVLTIAALGGEVDLATLERAAKSMGSALDALDEAELAGVIEVGPDRVHFSHPLVRASIVQATAPPLRRQMHRALAEALPAGDLDRRAGHVAAATVGPDETSAGLLEAAADSSARRHAYSVAAHWVERAAYASADPDSRSRRLTQAGKHAWFAGLTDRALEILGGAVASASSREARAEAQALRGVVCARCGSLVEARDLLLEVTDPSTAVDPDTAIELLAETVYACVFLCDPTALRTAIDRLDLLSGRAVSARSRLLDDLAAGVGRVMIGEGVAGTQQIRQAVVGFSGEAGDLAGDPRWRSWLLIAPIWLREAGDARAFVETVVTEARTRAAVGTLPFLLFHAARDDATTDRWRSADAGFREAITLAHESGERTDEAVARAGLACLLARQGREDEVRAMLPGTEALCVRIHANFARAWLRLAQGDLAAGLGRHEEAITSYRDQQALVRRFGIVDADLSPAPELVESLIRTGDLTEARREADEFEQLAAAKGQAWAQARAQRALAECGRDPDERYAEALVLHAGDLDVYERARTQLSYGAFLRRTRRRTRAREQLRDALATFDRLTAAPWAAQASVELAATGERVQRRGPGAEQRLTPQELQVARLLGEGRTTREAAAALFLSPKTVEYHLRHVYIKLDISSRAELADRLAHDSELLGDDTIE